MPKLSFKNKEEIMTFSGKQKVKEFIPWKPTLQVC